MQRPRARPRWRHRAIHADEKIWIGCLSRCWSCCLSLKECAAILFALEDHPCGEITSLPPHETCRRYEGIVYAFLIHAVHLYSAPRRKRHLFGWIVLAGPRRGIPQKSRKFKAFGAARRSKPAERIRLRGAAQDHTAEWAIIGTRPVLPKPRRPGAGVSLPCRANEPASHGMSSGQQLNASRRGSRSERDLSALE